MNGAVKELVYLRSGIKVEPLSNYWYLWGHLLPPLQEGINLVDRQLPLLESFVAHAADHVVAATDPEFLCAPIVHLPESEVSAIQCVLNDTKGWCASRMRLAKDMATLKRRLRAEAVGQSLDPQYVELPDSLRGLVEIMYDVDNSPKVRVIEELLYESEFSSGEGQQISFFAGSERARPFFLNTPRVEAENRMIFPLRFADQCMALLARSRLAPVDFNSISEALLSENADRSQLRRFFSHEPPTRVQPSYEGGEIRVRYFGQACVLLQTSEVSVLVDPVVTWDRDDEMGTLTFDDLPDFIDYVFITHAHVDHFCPEVLLQLRGRIGRILVPRNNEGSIADPSMRLMLRTLGFSNVSAMETFDRIEIPGGYLMSVPFLGEHADLDIRSKHGLYVRLREAGVLFLADSDCADPMLYRRMAAVTGRVDVVFIGMECHGAPLSWLYGQYLPARPTRQHDESRRLSGCNADRAWSIVEEFSCRRVFVYAMGQEPWLRHLSGLSYTPDSVQLVEAKRFLERCRNAGIQGEQLFGCKEFVI